MKLGGVFLVAVLILGACGDDGGDGDDGESPSTVPTEMPTLEMSVGSIGLVLTVDPDPPVAGENVTWISTITNRSSRDDKTLTFASGLQVDVALQQEGEEVYRWSADRVFTQALVEEELAPGESLEIRLDGILDVSAGRYDLLVEPRFQRARESELVGGGSVEVVEAD